MRSNVRLHFAEGSKLLGSDNVDDYQLDAEVNPQSLRHYFLWGHNLENVTIEGRGTIDGNGRAFWIDEFVNCNTVLRPKSERPVLLYLTECKDVVIRDVKFANSPSYTLWLLGCDNVRVSGLTIRNPRIGPNTDGLDIDCCQNVVISDCNIEAGDDCIAIKSHAARLGRDKPCENIVVSNCVLSSTTCGVRLGYEGDTPIRNCTFNNLAMHDCKHGIDLLSVRPECDFTSIKGTPIERINFSNIVMQKVRRAIFVWMGYEKPGNDFAGKIVTERFKIGHD